MQRMIRIVSILLLTILVVGCPYPPNVKVQMYPGPKVDRDKKAIIRGGRYVVPYYLGIIIVASETRVTIYQVDGNFMEADEVEVLPGPHEIGISGTVESEAAGCYGGSTKSGMGHSVIFKFEAQAGHKYKAKCHSTIKNPLLMSVKSIIIELIDERTKEVIGSEQFDH